MAENIELDDFVAGLGEDADEEAADEEAADDETSFSFQRQEEEQEGGGARRATARSRPLNF